MKTEILTSSLSGASINIHNTRKATEDYIWDMHIHKECEILKDAVSFFDEKSINRIYPALEYIENHYNENISLDDVSATLNVDKAHFCRLFKKATNTSFVQYLNFVRIQKAEKLLTETELSISEISHRVGFSSPTYFAETFRMIMNCTSRFYKKNKQ